MAAAASTWNVLHLLAVRLDVKALRGAFLNADALQLSNDLLHAGEVWATGTARQSMLCKRSVLHTYEDR